MELNVGNLIDTPTEQSLLNSFHFNDSSALSKLASITSIESYLTNQKDEDKMNGLNFKNKEIDDSSIQAFQHCFINNISNKKRGRKPSKTKSFDINNTNSDDQTKMRFGNRFVDRNSFEYILCRIRNNAAVKETRKKNSLKEKNIDVLIDRIKNENLVLGSQINSLKKEIDQLKQMNSSNI
jgi:hypothetical protein